MNAALVTAAAALGGIIIGAVLKHFFDVRAGRPAKLLEEELRYAVASCRRPTGRAGPTKRMPRPCATWSVPLPTTIPRTGRRVWLGSSAIAGYFETCGAVVAVAEAALALIVTGAAVRRTGHG